MGQREGSIGNGLNAQFRRLARRGLDASARAVAPYMAGAVQSSVHEEFERLRAERSTPEVAIIPYPHMDVPALSSRHVEGAKLYADRSDLIADLRDAFGGTIAEVGVAMGDFSEVILEKLAPQRFVAFDIFLMHHDAEIWGKPSEFYFHGLSHREAYVERFAKYDDPAVEVIEGMSAETLSVFPDETFDLIYIDAGHDYRNVSEDAAVAKAKIKQDGILVFNDYTMFDHITRDPYGVVPAVNELVVAEDWKILGFAFQPQMFCDIAIRRRS